MKNYDMIIIGAGVSGASMAQFLAKMGKKVLVVEKENHTGGAIKSYTHDDYTIDLGAHTIYNSYTALIRLMEVAGIENLIKGRTKQKYFFWRENKFKKLTSQLDKISLLWSLLKIFRLRKEGCTVREYYSQILGKKNYNKFARHFFKAVLSQNPDNFPADKILKRRKEKNKSYPRSITFEKGMQTVINSFLDDANITVVKNSPITSIHKDNENYILTSEKQTFSSANITLALHADTAAKLCNTINTELAEELEKIKYKEIHSVGIVVKKEKAKSAPFAGLLTQTDDFNSVVSRDIYPHATYRGFTMHSEHTSSEKKLLRGLCEASSVEQQDVIHKYSKINRLPILPKNHDTIIAAIKEKVMKTKGIYIVGNYFSGLSLEDCILTAEKESQRYLNDD